MRVRTRHISGISSFLLGLLVGLLAVPAWAQTGSSTTKPCVATASAPTYAEGSRVELSCELDGDLRTNATAGAGGDGAINDGVSSAIKATVFDFTNSNPLGVVLRDTNGDYVSVPSTVAQGTASTDTDQLAMMGCVRSDSAAVATGVIDGDRARCIVDSTGRLWTFSAQSGTWTVTQSGTWNIGTVTTLTGITNPVTVTQATGTNLHIVCDGGTCGGASPFADNSAFTFGTTGIGTIGYVFDDTAPNAVTENNAAAPRMSGNRVPYGILRDAAGNERGANVNASNELQVAATGTVTANAGTNLNTSALLTTTAHDAAFGTAGAADAQVRSIQGIASMTPVVVSATNLDVQIGGSDSLTIGTFPDNEPFNVAQINGVTPLMGNGITGTGSQRVTIASDNTAFSVNIGTFPDNEPINVAQMNGVAVTMGNGIAGTGVQRVAIASDNTAFTVNAAQATASSLNAEVQGDAATDAAVSGNPVYIGGRSEDSIDTAPGVRVTAEGEMTPLSVTRDGTLRVVVGGTQTWSYHENSSAALTDTTVHAAAGAGLHLYVCSIIFSTGAATAFNVFFEEGAATVLGPWYLEAVAGRGANLVFSPCKKQPTANTALTITTSAAIAHSVDITGYIAE